MRHFANDVGRVSNDTQCVSIETFMGTLAYRSHSLRSGDRCGQFAEPYCDGCSGAIGQLARSTRKYFRAFTGSAGIHYHLHFSDLTHQYYAASPHTSIVTSSANAPS